MFFGFDGEDPPHRARRIREAKRLCGQCPVLRPCRDQALTGVEQYGIWGGLTACERRAIIGSGRRHLLPAKRHC